MKVVWEKNNRVDELVGTGKISQEDVINRTTTDQFPEGKATVRLKDVRSKRPWVTVHIKSQHNPTLTQQGWMYWNCHHSQTTRVTFGGGWGTDVFNFNGYLQDSAPMKAIPKIIAEVKEALSIGDACNTNQNHCNSNIATSVPQNLI